MRVLVTGAAGMLGRDVVEAVAQRGHEPFGAGRAELDVTDAASIEAFLSEIAPEVVVNCAAWTDVDGAESNEAAAMAVNDAAAGIVSATAAAHGAKVLYISSDYVFDGTQGRALRRVGPARRALGLRALEAGGGDLDRDHEPAPLRRPDLVAVRRPRAPLRRDDAAHRGRAAGGDRRLRPGRPAPPTPATWRLRSPS